MFSHISIATLILFSYVSASPYLVKYLILILKIYEFFFFDQILISYGFDLFNNLFIQKNSHPYFIMPKELYL